MRHSARSKSTRYQRRLTFERCEPRLTLSGDGGFIVLDAGDFLSVEGNSFVVTLDDPRWQSAFVGASGYHSDSAGVPSFNVGGQYSFSGENLSNILNNVRDSSHNLTVGFVNFGDTRAAQVLGELNLTDRELQQLIDDHLAVGPLSSTQIPEPPLVPPSLVPPPLPPGAEVARTFVTSAERVAPLVEAIAEPSTDNAHQAANLPPITALEALLLARKEAEPPAAVHDSEPLAEGGPIEVEQAITAAQRAHESEVFAEVAAQLEGARALAQSEAPAERPLVGELARAVVFEVVGQEPTADETAPHDAGGPTASTQESAEPTAALAIRNERDENASSRALAFAEWPLYFSAALGGVLATRRRPQPGTTQHPPRRRGRQLFRR